MGCTSIHDALASACVAPTGLDVCDAFYRWLPPPATIRRPCGAGEVEVDDGAERLAGLRLPLKTFLA